MRFLHKGELLCFLKRKVLGLAPFFSFPLVSPHGPHPRRRATRELRGVELFRLPRKSLAPHLGARRGGAVRRSEQGRRINGVSPLLHSRESILMDLHMFSDEVLSFELSFR